MEATKPRSMTSRRISGTLQRDSGTCDSYGSWQAKALMATTRLGGKERRAPAAGAFLKTPQSFSEEALAPLADNLARCVQARGDGIVVEPRGGIQHDLGANDFSIR